MKTHLHKSVMPVILLAAAMFLAGCATPDADLAACPEEASTNAPSAEASASTNAPLAAVADQHPSRDGSVREYPGQSVRSVQFTTEGHCAVGGLVVAQLSARPLPAGVRVGAVNLAPEHLGAGSDRP